MMFPIEEKFDDSVTNPSYPLYKSEPPEEDETHTGESIETVHEYVLETRSSVSRALMKSLQSLESRISAQLRTAIWSEVLIAFPKESEISFSKIIWSDPADVTRQVLSYSALLEKHLHSSGILVNAVDQAILEKYSEESQVEAIYRDQENGKLSFWIFTSNKKYDDALMDRLIQKEEEILGTYSEFVISIDYAPSILLDNHLEVIGDTATQIFERE